MSNQSPKLDVGEFFKIKNKKEIYIKCKYKSIKVIKILPKINFLKIIKTI